MPSLRRTMSAVAALTLAAAATAAGTGEGFARSHSPFAELGASLEHLFSPPRRAKRVKARHARAEASEPLRARKAGAEAGAAAVPEPPARPREAPPRKVPTGRLTMTDRFVPQPRPRPPEAPARPARPTKSAAAQDAAVAPSPKPPEKEPHRARTAALPPPSQGTGGAPEPTPESAAPANPPGPPPPSACQLRLTPDLAAVHILPPLTAGQCTVEDVVRLEAVVAKDGHRVAVTPPATLRCPMAESVIHWIRDEVVQVAVDLAAPLKSVTVDDSFECRGRNRVAGAKLSEHGHANAIDITGFTLVGGKSITLTDAAVDKGARERLRQSACTRFTTVLGPGSDGYHENHIHLDLAERRSGYRICQWDVRVPGDIARVPLPPERPASAPPRSASAARSGTRE